MVLVLSNIYKITYVLVTYKMKFGTSMLAALWNNVCYMKSKYHVS